MSVKKVQPKKPRNPKKKSLSRPKKHFINPHEFDNDTGFPTASIFGAIGPMILSFAIKKGIDKYKNYTEADAMRKLTEDTIERVKKSAIYKKEPVNIQDIIILFVREGRDPYPIIGANLSDSDIYTKFLYNKKRFFSGLPEIEKNILDAAMAYIKINKTLLLS